MSERRFWWAIASIVLLAAVLRGLFPAADPPWRSSVGVVWHDEGAWTHNARNKALDGAWVQDQWNPVYIAPVFTALEYASFAAFGVGLRQARLVSEAAGVLSVLLLALGVRRIGGSTAAAIAAALLATNYVYVMYDRAAIMEALMAAFIVASWYCVTRAERSRAAAVLAGVFAVLAFFTKAAAAFYVAALVVTVVLDLPPESELPPKSELPPRGGSYGALLSSAAVVSAFRRNLWLLIGLAVSFGFIGAFFVLPHWTDYRFYNWQMSVTRKPSYDLHSLVMRVTWLPIVHDLFSRMWLALVLGTCGGWSVVLRWRQASQGERLLVLWVLIGITELLVHDDGNERRLVFLIPALVALASLVLARGVLFARELDEVSRRQLIAAAPIILYCAYVLVGPITRLPFRDQVIDEHKLKLPVRLAAIGAVALVAALVAWWPQVRASLQRVRWTPRLAAALALAAGAWNAAQFADWAVHRTYKNYEASVELGRALPPGTLVQGKLANGLALENRIRPIFIGHEFGNYADRKQRDDVRYILTYTSPRLGYEGSQITDVLDASPGWRIIMTFDVAESRAGNDTAALIDKRARD
jgi:Dolichyl-phosphate-mannose-protein mannosyltransferase